MKPYVSINTSATKSSVYRTVQFTYRIPTPNELLKMKPATRVTQ